MDGNNPTPYQVRRVVAVLVRHGITSRTVFWLRYDNRITAKQLEALDGIGPVLAPVLHGLLALDEGEWQAQTGLAA